MSVPSDASIKTFHVTRHTSQLYLLTLTMASTTSITVQCLKQHLYASHAETRSLILPFLITKPTWHSLGTVLFLFSFNVRSQTSISSCSRDQINAAEVQWHQLLPVCAFYTGNYIVTHGSYLSALEIRLGIIKHYTPCLEKKETKMFSVISPTKLWWNLAHSFLNKFAATWCKRFPPHLNNVSTLPCETWNAHRMPTACYNCVVR